MSNTTITKTTIAPSNQPATKVLDILVVAENFCLVVSALIAVTVLAGWMLSPVGATLPNGWSLMKANTALAVLLFTACLTLTKPKRSAPLYLAGRVCAAVAVYIASVTLFEHWSGYSTGLDTLLAADGTAHMPGPMSIQSASLLVLLGLSLMIKRSQIGLFGHVLDALTTLVVMWGMALIAVYIFGAFDLIGQPLTIRASPQTLICLSFLAYVQAGRRAPYGYFSVLTGVGIGSQFARIALPISQGLMILFIGVGVSLLTAGYLIVPYAAAVMASSMATIIFVLIIFMARKINDLERTLRDMSLSDELTGLHNRRGFYFLGEGALKDAQRAAIPLTVLFLDADGLKQVNDVLGHDVGSELLRDIAHLLQKTFRNSDVIGRLGGDEFAIIAHEHQTDLNRALQRLNSAVEAENGAGNKPYQISFSVGRVTIEPDSDETFAKLVDRADTDMYRDKRKRRAAREANCDAQKVTEDDANSRRSSA